MNVYVYTPCSSQVARLLGDNVKEAFIMGYILLFLDSFLHLVLPDGCSHLFQGNLVHS
jgi:hypothetical protein